MKLIGITMTHGLVIPIPTLSHPRMAIFADLTQTTALEIIELNGRHFVTFKGTIHRYFFKFSDNIIGMRANRGLASPHLQFGNHKFEIVLCRIFEILDLIIATGTKKQAKHEGLNDSPPWNGFDRH